MDPEKSLDLNLAACALKPFYGHQRPFQSAVQACSDLPVASLKFTCVLLPGVAVIHYSVALESLRWQHCRILPLTVHNTQTKTMTIPLPANETIHHLLFKRSNTCLSWGKLLSCESSALIPIDSNDWYQICVFMINTKCDNEGIHLLMCYNIKDIASHYHTDEKKSLLYLFFKTKIIILHVLCKYRMSIHMCSAG